MTPDTDFDLAFASVLTGIVGALVAAEHGSAFPTSWGVLASLAPLAWGLLDRLGNPTTLDGKPTPESEL